MSIARYLSKLAALIGSDGKVPAAGLADASVTTAKLVDANVTTAKINDAAVTVAKLSGSGVPSFDGIKFPATQVASSDANTLDDYEEGTFTPTIYGTTTAGTTTYESGNTWGRYVKIGGWVFIQFSIAWSSSTGATGYVNVGGLPFTSKNFTNHYATAPMGYYNYGASSGWGSYFQAGLVIPNTTAIGMYYSGSTTMSGLGTTVLNASGGNLYMSAMYLVA